MKLERETIDDRPIERPQDSDDTFLANCRYTCDLEGSSAQLRKHVVKRIDKVGELERWYLRHEGPKPEERLGTLLDGQSERLCERYNYYRGVVLRYRQGAAPMQIIETDRRLAQIYLDRVVKLLDDKRNVREASRKLNEIFRLITEREDRVESHQEYVKMLDRLFDELFKAIMAIADQFAQIDARDDAGEAVEKPLTEDVFKAEMESLKTSGKESAKKIIKETKLESRRLERRTGEMVGCELVVANPKSKVRARQYQRVADKLREFGADRELLPTDLKHKQPEKWVRYACSLVWGVLPDGYPNVSALYNYCHRHAQELLALAAL